MKTRKGHSLKGSSLVEVLISLAIGSFCMALAAVIYLNIQKSSLPFFKVKALELAEYYMQETLYKNSLFDESYTAETFTIRKTVTRSEIFPDCILIRMLVFDGSKKKVCELETLVRN